LKAHVKKVSWCASIDRSFLSFPLSRNDLYADVAFMIILEFFLGELLIDRIAKFGIFAKVDPQLEPKRLLFL
jgi:hypothetical protein